MRKKGSKQKQKQKGLVFVFFLIFKNFFRKVLSLMSLNHDAPKNLESIKLKSRINKSSIKK